MSEVHQKYVVRMMENGPKEEDQMFMDMYFNCLIRSDVDTD